MQSLRELYKIGRGPSSSHTMGPEKASRLFREENKEADFFKVILYGSLAKTGAGHGTDKIIRETLSIRTEIVFDTVTESPHPNTMDFFAYKNGNELSRMRVYSVGGGTILVEGRAEIAPQEVYPHDSFAAIRDYCREKDIRLCDYVKKREGDGIYEYLAKVWRQMQNSIRQGLAKGGKLPGGLEVDRKAMYLYRQHRIDESAETRQNRLVCAYAFAVSEENASGGTVVTAPTCGSCGVLPAVLYYMQKKHSLPDSKIVEALATGGLVGNLIKRNASISGAECGCQAEIGSACAMAAAALGELFELDIDQIEYAAEVAIEHHLGLTCDPVCGLVQIPCIERNAVGAMRAIDAVSLADFLTYSRKVSLDTVIRTMYETGRDLKKDYRETSEGGLAKLYQQSG